MLKYPPTGKSIGHFKNRKKSFSQGDFKYYSRYLTVINVTRDNIAAKI